MAGLNTSIDSYASQGSENFDGDPIARLSETEWLSFFNIVVPPAVIGRTNNVPCTTNCDLTQNNHNKVVRYAQCASTRCAEVGPACPVRYRIVNCQLARTFVVHQNHDHLAVFVGPEKQHGIHPVIRQRILELLTTPKITPKQIHIRIVNEFQGHPMPSLEQVQGLVTRTRKANNVNSNEVDPVKELIKANMFALR